MENGLNKLTKERSDLEFQSSVRLIEVRLGKFIVLKESYYQYKITFH